MRARHLPVTAAAMALVAFAIWPPAPVSADAGAVLVSGSALPAEPPLGGVLRLDLQVRNATARAWSVNDQLHLKWRRSNGSTATEEIRPLGHPVPAAATVTLDLVTLAPAETGAFTLTTTLDAGGQQLAIGAPMPFSLDGFLFMGRGNGHGLGMSQWGARGRAEAGQDYRTILSSYYHGTQLEHRDTSGSIRVALTHDPIDLSRPWSKLFGPFPEIAGPITVDGLTVQVPAGALLGFAADQNATPSAFVQSAGGSRTDLKPLTGTITVHAQSTAGIRTNLSQSLDSDFRQGSEQTRYAGILRVIPTGGAGIRAVNVLPFEDYLKGVVPAEMPFSWGGEALKAQAVAARTYAYRKMVLSPQPNYDIEGTTFDQAYSGLSQQRAESNAAIDATRGEVISSGGHTIDALFEASNGGHSSDSEYGFVTWDHGLHLASKISYLRGISDPYDHAPPWTVGPFSPTDAATLLRDEGEDLGNQLLGIDILQRSPAGRIMGVRLRGSSGSDEISGPDLRGFFGLPDTLVDIVGSR